MFTQPPLERYHTARAALAESLTRPTAPIDATLIQTDYTTALAAYALTPDGEADLRRRAHFATIDGDCPHLIPGEPFRELAADLLAAANTAALWNHRHPAAA